MGGKWVGGGREGKRVEKIRGLIKGLHERG